MPRAQRGGHGHVPEPVGAGHRQQVPHPARRGVGGEWWDEVDGGWDEVDGGYILVNDGECELLRVCMPFNDGCLIWMTVDDADQWC